MNDTLNNKIMKTTKINTGLYKHTNRYNETWILRLTFPTNGQGKSYWVAYECENQYETSSNNMVCEMFYTKKSVIKFLNK